VAENPHPRQNEQMMHYFGLTADFGLSKLHLYEMDMG
jgi:hypothetical protein